MKYFLIPGRTHNISTVEINELLKTSQIPFVQLRNEEHYFLYDIQIDIEEAENLFNKLGGFTKIGFIVDDPYEYLEDILLPKAQEMDSQVRFSVSFHAPEKIKRARDKFRLGMEIKNWLKDRDISCQFVSKRGTSVTSNVLIEKKNVLDRGFDLIQIEDRKRDDKIWGFTIAIQDFEAFSTRDYDRPEANKEKGMLPPKLSRMMINISGVKESETLWDPFCGSGTVLMEGLCLGHRVVGSDIDEKSVTESRANLEWICERRGISHKRYDVFKHDITKGIPEQIKNYNSIVTEPYLGPVQKEVMDVDEFKQVVDELEPIYESISKIIEQTPEDKERRMVIVLPGFRTGRGWFDMEPNFIAQSRMKDITGDISDTPLQWYRSSSIIRRNIKIFEF